MQAQAIDMRRWLAVAALVALGALTAAGCGDSSTGDGGDGGGGGGNLAVEGQKLGGGGTTADEKPISTYCGDKEITVALADGFGGNSWRRITRKEFEDEAAKCKNITKVLYTDGQNDPQKAISDIKGLAAQGVNALVVFPDAGKAMLPAIKEATRAGVAVVPYTSDPGGEPGKDYVDFVGPNFINDGSGQAKWLFEQLGGKGNVIYLGGTPGNTQSEVEVEGVKQVMEDYPGIKLLAGPVDTNWDPAQTQKVVAGLLSKYPKIDGIMSDYGGGSVGGLRAYIQAGKPIPPWAANDANEFACMWKEHKGPKNPDYEIYTTSSRTWLVRNALRKAVAAAQGIKNDEPSILDIPAAEDSTDPSKQPKCDPSLPPDAILSSKLPPEKLKEIFAQ